METISSVAKQIMQSDSSRAAVLLILTYKMGESLGDAMFKPMLLDRGTCVCVCVVQDLISPITA